MTPHMTVIVMSTNHSVPLLHLYACRLRAYLATSAPAPVDRPMDTHTHRLMVHTVLSYACFSFVIKYVSMNNSLNLNE